jgi:hypothetical protein
MKDLRDYINEGRNGNIDVPLSEILGSDGRSLAHIPYFNNAREYYNHPRCQFVFNTAKEAKDFRDTTFSREFWLAIYDYDSVMLDSNDYANINSNMSKFGNLMNGKNLCVYCIDDAMKDELFKRCKNAEKEYKFKSVEYIEI